MFDKLSTAFSSLFSRMRGKSAITEKEIATSIAQVEDVLLDADVPYDTVKAFVTDVSDSLVGSQKVKSLCSAEQVVKVMHDRIVHFLGGAESVPFSFQLPSIVMVMGVQGSGKTTTVAKMAHFVKKEAEKRNKKRSILVASVDFYRPAAIDQLEVVAAQAGVSFYRAQSSTVKRAAQEIVDFYRNNQFELLFLDTAGRLHVDDALMQELSALNALVKPNYKLLVLDAMTGQESLSIAQSFDQSIGFHASILTKMDSDTRGGAAFSFRYTLKKPIIFSGCGETVDDLERFHPDRIASRMIGMGDLKTLLEKAEEKLQSAEMDASARSFAKDGSLSLEDFAQQMDAMGKIGSLTKIAQYIPGAKGVLSDHMVEQGERDLKKFRAIISSMTRKERIYPRCIDYERKRRIALGSGVNIADVSELLKRFKEAQKYGKLLKKSGQWGQLFR